MHDYWIVNLVDRVLEVRREAAATPSGWSYGALAILEPGAALLPRATYSR